MAESFVESYRNTQRSLTVVGIDSENWGMTMVNCNSPTSLSPS
jgi:hypothetical protein